MPLHCAGADLKRSGLATPFFRLPPILTKRWREPALCCCRSRQPGTAFFLRAKANKRRQSRFRQFWRVCAPERFFWEANCRPTGWSKRKGTVRFAPISEKLGALGAKVGVLARSSAALAKAELHGAQTRSFLQGVPPFFKDCRVLFNTVPERVFDVPLLSALPQNCILIELASAPGGFAPELANSMGLKVIPAQGLPGRFYPEAAGNILADAVCKILRANGFLD